MKKVLIIIICFIGVFIGINKVEANTINSIDMDIYIDEYGDASVKEVWNTYLDEGTEGYKVFNNLGNSEIRNFIVTDETGREYTYIVPWRTNLSFGAKAYKNGFNHKGNDIELCWGISSYGNRTYTLNYKITNFVTEYSDFQGIYFKLLNLDQKVGNVYISLSTYKNLNVDNSKIWGFGYKGNLNFNNNKIIINTNNLKSHEYITLLMKFENNLFTTNNKINKPFDDIYNEAMDGVEKSKSDGLNNFFISFFSHPFIMIIMFFILAIFLRYLAVFILTVISNIFENIFPNNNYEFEMSIKKLKKNKTINYYRDIPCNKDIELAYFILNKLNIINTKTLKKGIVGAFILKWLKLGYITVSNDKKSLIINDDIYSSIWKKELTLDSYYENKLYMILHQASNDSILNPNEFKKWSRKNYKILNSWYSDILINKKSEIEHLIVHSVKKSFFGTETYYKEFNERLMNDAYNLIGLKKFLLDFSNIKDRSSIEVELWEYYLIFATLFGITDKIDNELKELYPDLNIDDYLKFNELLKMIDDFSESSYRGMKTSINISNFRNDYIDMLESMNEGSDSSYSGGGGSSFSGGGSSSGGSSGGGFR